MGWQLFLSLSLAFIGMLGFSLTQARNFQPVFGKAPTVLSRASTSIAGSVGVMGCVASSVWTWGGPMGVVGSVGLLSASGLLLAFMFTYLPRFLMVGVGFAFVSLIAGALCI